MNHKIIISPSILSADFARLGEDVQKVLNAGADRIHFDVMDNNYVPNLSFGAPICKSLRDFGIKAPIDVHLMTNEVMRLAKDFQQAGADHITFHYEAVTHLDCTIDYIKSLGLTVGVAINPGTPATVLEPIIHKLDLVLVMTVNPGFGGQKFIPYTCKKITYLKNLIRSNNLSCEIQVDGGIKSDTIKQASQAGATNFVAGSAIFGQVDYEHEVTTLRKNAQEASLDLV